MLRPSEEQSIPAQTSRTSTAMKSVPVLLAFFSVTYSAVKCQAPDAYRRIYGPLLEQCRTNIVATDQDIQDVLDLKTDVGWTSACLTDCADGLHYGVLKDEHYTNHEATKEKLLELIYEDERAVSIVDTLITDCFAPAYDVEPDDCNAAMYIVNCFVKYLDGSLWTTCTEEICNYTVPVRRYSIPL